MKTQIVIRFLSWIVLAIGITSFAWGLAIIKQTPLYLGGKIELLDRAQADLNVGLMRVISGLTLCLLAFVFSEIRNWFSEK